MVLVSATVVDRMERFVTDLDGTNFRLFDGNTEQKIVSVTLEDTPLSVGIVFDSSGSMKRSQKFAVQALREFLGTSDRRDEYFVVQVRDRPELTLDFTSDAEQVFTQLSSAPPIGSTALIDSVYLAASHMRGAQHSRRMLLVITDGEDNNSRYSFKELRRMLEEANVAVYSIGIGIHTPSFFETGLTAVQLMTQMAEITGGRYFETAYAEDLPDIMRKIDIRYQYVLGFVPGAAAADGKYHRLQLKLVNAERLRVFSRPGYYAPAMTARAQQAESPRRQAILRPDPGDDADR